MGAGTGTWRQDDTKHSKQSAVGVLQEQGWQGGARARKTIGQHTHTHFFYPMYACLGCDLPML